MLYLPHRRKAFRSAGGGTDWTADATMKALWNFEASPGLEQDSVGNNHIDDRVSGDPPTANTTSGEFKQGSQGAYYTPNGTPKDSSVCSNANLDSDFPAKSSGHRKVTYACWIYPDTTTGTMYLSAYSSAINRWFITGANLMGVKWYGATADVSANATATTAISDTTLQFVATVYDADAQLAYFYQCDDGGSSTWESVACNAGSLDVQTTDWIVGNSTENGAFGFDGTIDAFGVFQGKAMNQTELDGVRDNGWTGSGW